MTPVVTGLNAPTHVTSDGGPRLFILEQGGRIRLFDGTSLLPTPFLDLSSQTVGGGERGLLGLAFHPAYASNGRFFVYYTNLAGNIEIAEYRVSADPNAADPGSGRRLLMIKHPRYSNHNGGQMAFGPDGYLYIGTGDGGGPARKGGRNAQSLRSLLGKILRIDVNGAAPYAVPADNPFVGRRGAKKEIWAFGFRNPWRFSFDNLTGALIVADVGQSAWEEVDFVIPGGNYGWAVMEGNHCFSKPSCASSRYIAPIFEYPHTGTRFAVIGGFIYRGTNVPSLAGKYLFGDFGSGELFAIAPAPDGTWTGGPVFASDISLSSIGQDNAGEPYLADLKGTIYRLGE